MNIEKENNWLIPSKQKQSRQALLTGELPPEEIEFMKDKGELEKEVYRLEVIESVIKATKEQDEQALKSMKEHYSESRDSLKY